MHHRHRGALPGAVAGAKANDVAPLMLLELWPLLLLLPVFGIFLPFHHGPLPGEPEGSRFIDVDGVRIRYTDSGEAGRPVVLMLHGFASTLDAWKPVAPALSPGHRIVSLDMKGFGWSSRPAGDYSPQAHARLVLRLLDLLGVEKTAIVAHSWGCSVALATTLAAPERVTKLALYDAWVYARQLPAFFYWARTDFVGEMMFGLYYRMSPKVRMRLAFYDEKHITKELVEHVTSGLNRPGTVAAALAAVRGQRFEALEHAYRTVQQPTLILWGREDQVSALEHGRRLARELPNAKLVIYPECGHFPMIEARDASNRDLAAFLEGTLEGPMEKAA